MKQIDGNKVVNKASHLHNTYGYRDVITMTIYLMLGCQIIFTSSIIISIFFYFFEKNALE